MSTANNTRLIATKAVLWLLAGLATTVAAVRYARGLGATTALTDANPWGLWVGFDVLSGVALAAGGFVIAATVYIFHIEGYRGLVRPAVLTAFLGYVAVALGLMVDLGRPWNIWRPIFFWQPHSPLFEVAWCVMLYLTVLALEFLPVVFEGLKMSRAFRLMRRMTLPLVIAGIGLSTLHQSSLGTLFLLARDRMHPLWYSPLLPLLFFVSAVSLGLAMVTFESCVSSWLFRRQGEWPALRGLTRAASVVLLLYLVIRLGDLAARGQLHHALDGTWASLLFAAELAMSAVVPILLFTLPAAHRRHRAIFGAAALSVAGFILHRADVGGIAHIPVTGVPYVPALTELIISVGLVSAMALVFLFFVERLPVWEEPPAVPGHFTPPIADPVTGTFFGGRWFGRSHLAAAAFAVGAVVGVVVLETTTAGRAEPRPTPVAAVRATAAIRRHVEGGRPERPQPVAAPAVFHGQLPAGFTTVLLIDGDRAGVNALFDHQAHQKRLGGELSCGRCHHWNARNDRGTRCSACHRDMYRTTDTFDHQGHVDRLRGNASCKRCHRLAGTGKARPVATPCHECHEQDMSTTFTVTRSESAVSGVAPGYRDAMHRLCVDCHRQWEAETAVDEPYLSRCTWCHPPRTGVEEAAPASTRALIARLGAP